MGKSGRVGVRGDSKEEGKERRMGREGESICCPLKYLTLCACAAGLQ